MTTQTTAEPLVPSVLGLNASHIVEVRDLSRRYVTGGTELLALDTVSMGFVVGSFTAVMGPSGSGKSSLLQCAAGLDRPTSGSVVVCGQELSTLSETKLARFRLENIGFVFQAFNLLPELSAADNVALPVRLAGGRVSRAAAITMLDQVGLAQKHRARPGQLSGGQQQRVAIARALMTRPRVIFADEPTGALDSHAAGEVLTLLRRGVTEAGMTVVMVTHDPSAAAHADRVVFLSDGHVAGELDVPTPEQVAAHMTHLAAPSVTTRSSKAVT
jgi:putative ABC transport system ATP-binding protein